LRAAGFNALGQDIPIVPVILGGEKITMEMSRRIYAKGVFITGIIFPFQPIGMGMIRTQITAVHTREHLDRAIAIFTEVGKELGIIK
jgi:glycine C-acetyltransferase